MSVVQPIGPGQTVKKLYKDDEEAVQALYPESGDNQWKRKTSYPGKVTAPRGLVSFSIKDKGYALDSSWIGASQPGEVWEYDAKKNKWTRKNNHPGIEYRYPYFVIDDRAYFLTGGNQLWRYSPKSDSWEKKSSIPGADKLGGFGMEVDKNGYVGGGFYNGQSFWEYNPEKESIKKLSDHPVLSSIVCNQGSNCDIDAVTFSIKKKGYVTGTNMNFYEYDKDKRKWTKKSYVDAVYGKTLTINGDSYVYNARGDFYQYDVSHDVWLWRSQFPQNQLICYAQGFEIDGKGYIGMGGIMENNSCLLEMNAGLWEYKPPK